MRPCLKLFLNFIIDASRKKQVKVRRSLKSHAIIRENMKLNWNLRQRLSKNMNEKLVRGLE